MLRVPRQVFPANKRERRHVHPDIRRKPDGLFQKARLHSPGGPLQELTTALLGRQLASRATTGTLYIHNIFINQTGP